MIHAAMFDFDQTLADSTRGAVEMLVQSSNSASGRLAAREVVYDEAREGVTVDASDQELQYGRPWA
jgi:phosphoglycolate phosphatase-like HAD superfamily hydrolase